MHTLVKLDGKKKVISDKLLKNLETVEQLELDNILPNLIDLESFSEGIILHQCGERYKREKIYTFVGTILVAVNPFKRLDIYNEEVVSWDGGELERGDGYQGMKWSEEINIPAAHVRSTV